MQVGDQIIYKRAVYVRPKGHRVTSTVFAGMKEIPVKIIDIRQQKNLGKTWTEYKVEFLEAACGFEAGFICWIEDKEAK